MAGCREGDSAQIGGSEQYSFEFHEDVEDEHALQWDRHSCVGGSGRGEVLERQIRRLQRVRMRTCGSKGIDAGAWRPQTHVHRRVEHAPAGGQNGSRSSHQELGAKRSLQGAVFNYNENRVA